MWWLNELLAYKCSVEVLSCPLLLNIPLCEYLFHHVSIHCWWTFGLFSVGGYDDEHTWTHQLVSLVNMCRHFSRVYDRWGIATFNCSRSFQWLYQLTLLPAADECSRYSTFLPTLGFCQGEFLDSHCLCIWLPWVLVVAPGGFSSCGV